MKHSADYNYYGVGSYYSLKIFSGALACVPTSFYRLYEINSSTRLYRDDYKYLGSDGKLYNSSYEAWKAKKTVTTQDKAVTSDAELTSESQIDAAWLKFTKAIANIYLVQHSLYPDYDLNNDGKLTIDELQMIDTARTRFLSGASVLPSDTRYFNTFKQVLRDIKSRFDEYKAALL